MSVIVAVLLTANLLATLFLWHDVNTLVSAVRALAETLERPLRLLKGGRTK